MVWENKAMELMEWHPKEVFQVNENGLSLPALFGSMDDYING